VRPYYEDESVTLFHGDCREVTAWLEADVLVTDPPYGRGWRQGDIEDLRGWPKSRNAASLTGIANDDSTAARDGALALWGNGPAIVFGDLMLAPPEGTKLTCIYHKMDPTSGLRGAIAGVRRDAEAIYLIGNWGRSSIGGRSSVFATRQQISSAHGIVALNGGHPHTKAGDVMHQLVTLTTGTVADPFAGSGSTLVAAKQLGRKAIGVELEERYCEVIAKRLAQGVLDFGSAS
jgi:site-specific DNA-methyltransferase (adenine-specific)